ncbi:hypothetical protein [Nevskia soli]|uniref:hypothetical protein n=1 Tax=Nevskia soli TaxID=418856 RepID=UPI0004A70685|nr:hypothetical protein [Nevskia soli]
MKRLHLGMVATVIVLTGLGTYYVYQYEYGDAALAAATASALGSAAESAAKADDESANKPPVSRVAQTVPTWPSDKHPVSGQAEVVSAVEAMPPHGEGEGALAPTAEQSPTQPAALASEVAAGQESAPQLPAQRDSVRDEGAAPEYNSADSRTAQTTLLASGSEHPAKAPVNETQASNEGRSIGAEQPPSATAEADSSVAEPPVATQEAPAERQKSLKAPSAAKVKPVQKEGDEKAALNTMKAASAVGRPFDAAASWWPAVGRDSAKLSLVYAGEAAFDKAIVLLFSRTVSPGAGGQIRMLDGSGKVVTGNWSVSPKNPQMLICKVPPGRYLVSIAAELSDSAGEKLGNSLQGPVYVH